MKYIHSLCDFGVQVIISVLKSVLKINVKTVQKDCTKLTLQL